MISAVVLAAGGSSRLGRPKQLVELGGRTLLRRTVDCCVAASCSPVIVVLGAERDRIRPQLDGLEVRVAVNPDWRDGIASSIRVGIAALPSKVGATIVTVCDQPRLAPELLRRVIGAFDGAPGRIVACEYAGTLGVPALFERSRFDELSGLAGDQGAKTLLLERDERIARISWPDGEIDVNREGDLAGF